MILKTTIEPIAKSLSSVSSYWHRSFVRILIVGIFLFAANKELLADDYILATITNPIVILPAATNITTAPEKNTNDTAETESLPFEGLRPEKIKEVTDSAKNLSSIPKKNFSWDVHWDNGIRYQLGHQHPLWSIIYFDSKNNGFE